jgi:AcrR family transcriptional regulator
VSTRASDTRPPRDRLLDAASELFYQHGVHTVGIDTIIERAGVAKASLYSTFGSKEELVRAYLEARHASRRAAVLAEMELHDDPRGKLLAVFDVLDTTVKQSEFRGCAFANASAESEPDSAATEVTRKVRAWLLGVMAEQATALGAADPAGLARQLTLLYDGALAQSRLERGPTAATAAKAAAQVLIDGAFPAAQKPQSRPTRAARSTRSQPPGRLPAGHMRLSVVGCADPFP